MAENSPVETSHQARPAASSAVYTQARKLFFFSSSISWLMTVPGVTTLMTSLATMPLASAGSSICSAIATLCPFSSSLER